MEEISTRFKIVELAVKLGDRDTIGIQAKKLRDISLDENLDEIITLLESNNFRQALFLMKNYSGTLKDDFFSDDDESDEFADTERDDKTNREIGRSESGIKIITVDDLLNLSDRSKESIAEYDNSRNRDIEKIEEIHTENNRDDSEDDDILHIGSPYNDHTESEYSKTDKTIPSDPLYDKHAQDDEEISSETDSTIPEPIYDYQPAPTFELDIEEETDRVSKDIEQIDNDKLLEDEKIVDNDTNKYSDDTDEFENTQRGNALPENENEEYTPMAHIELKFKNMMNQYPPLDSGEDMAVEIYPMIDKISQEGYSEQDIWDFLENYHRYKESGDIASAAQVLLLAAATESKFAQFLLARELFSGDVVEKDHGEAFTQIKLLAEKNFPEAICDLGQFYEYGIGIDKDKKMALILYEEAAELGVERAQRHVERLKKSKGLFKLFKF